MIVSAPASSAVRYLLALLAAGPLLAAPAAAGEAGRTPAPSASAATPASASRMLCGRPAIRPI